ncbi:MAG: amidohydrolase family protein [Anaerolineae bacterium]|nr:amidohydrolase family protein [Anaerolineae bacterium]
MSNLLRDRLAAVFDDTPIIDTHEHLRTDGDHAFNHMGLETVLRGYFGWVVPGAANEEGLSPEAWWTRLRPALDRRRNLAFYRFLLPAFRDLHGLQDDELTDENWETLDQRIRDAYQDPSWFRHVLQERAHIQTILHDPYWKVGDGRPEQPFYRVALRINSLLYGYNRDARDHNGNTPYTVAERLGLEVDTFDDYLALCEAFVRHGLEQGAVCLKGAIAYDRSLDFQPTPKDVAARAFGHPSEDLTPGEVKAFQDYIVFFLAEQARAHNVPFQIHTGLARLDGSRAMFLIPLIQAFPDVRFVLMHGNYPWIHDLAGLVLSFPNVYLDLVWLPILSPTAARRALHEYLEVAPADRITWGGDCWTAEETYGALIYMRDLLLDVLTEKVQSGYFGEALARDLIRRILHETPKELYAL